MITEDAAAQTLRQVVAQKRAAEFMEKVCFGGDAFTWDPDGRLIIFPGSALEDMQ
jgi:hypothetical protein